MLFWVFFFSVRINNFPSIFVGKRGEKEKNHSIQSKIFSSTTSNFPTQPKIFSFYKGSLSKTFSLYLSLSLAVLFLSLQSYGDIKFVSAFELSNPYFSLSLQSLYPFFDSVALFDSNLKIFSF